MQWGSYVSEMVVVERGRLEGSIGLFSSSSGILVFTVYFLANLFSFFPLYFYSRCGVPQTVVSNYLELEAGLVKSFSCDKLVIASDYPKNSC